LPETVELRTAFFLLGVMTYLVLSLLVDAKKNDGYRGVTALFLVLIYLHVLSLVGFRPLALVGDTARYAWVYSQLTGVVEAWWDGKYHYHNEEFLFWPLAGFLKVVGFSYRDWLIFISSWFFVLTLAAYKNLGLGRLWWIPFGSLFFTFHLVFLNAIRQSMAECLVLVAYVLLLRDKYLYASLVFVLSLGFHYSSVFALLLIPAVFLQLRSSMWLFAVVCSFLLGGFFPFIIESAFEFSGGGNPFVGKVDSYVVDGSVNEFEDLWGLKQFLLILFASFSYLICFYSTRKREVSLLYPYVGCFLSLLLLTSSVPVVSGRLMQYLSLVFPVMVWEVSGIYLRNSSRRFIYPLVFIFLGFLVVGSESTQAILGVKLW
jgi:EpsG family